MKFFSTDDKRYGAAGVSRLLRTPFITNGVNPFAALDKRIIKAGL